MAVRPFRPGSIGADMVPSTTETYNIGSTTKKWLTALIVTLLATTATITGKLSVGGELNVSLINSSSSSILFRTDNTQRMNISTILTIDTNLTQAANYFHCFNASCGKYIYDNGSALIIKVT